MITQIQNQNQIQNKINLWENYRLPLDTLPKNLKNFIICPKCKLGTIKQLANVYYGFCNLCPNKSTYYCFWEPMPHQKILLNLTEKWIYNFGGVGTGKTEASCAKIFRHLIEIDNSYVIVIANDIQTAIDMVNDVLFKFLPIEFIKKVDGQARLAKTKTKFTLNNGSSLQIFSSQNPETYRGRNATYGWVLEANTIKKDVVQELIGRIRNENQIIYAKDSKDNFIFEKDKRGVLRKKILWEFGQIIIETNPDESSWIFKDGLLTCGKVFWSYNYAQGRGISIYQNLKIKKDPNKVAIASAVYDNKYAPNGLIDGLEGLDEITKRKLLFGEFVIDGSPVWPNLYKTEVKNVPHKNNWPHLLFGDWGTTNDPVAAIYAYIDPYRQKLIIWKAEKIFQKSISKIGYHWKKDFSQRNYLYNKKIVDSAIGHKNPDYNTDGGLSVQEQLNQNPLNLGISLSKKGIKEGEIRTALLIDENMIEFDVTGENVLELKETLSRAHYPKANDNTKSGIRKDIAKVIKDNHWYDCFLYLGLDTDNNWIKEISQDWLNNHQSLTQNEKINPYLEAAHALDLPISGIINPRQQLNLNYKNFINEDYEDTDNNTLSINYD